MAAYVLIGVFSAFGALCALWVLTGWFLPRPRGGVLVYSCREDGDESAVRRYMWLRDLGLLRCPLILLDSSLPLWRRQQLMQRCSAVRFYTTAKWVNLLEQERKDRGGTGIGNAAGNHCGGDLPEL